MILLASELKPNPRIEPRLLTAEMLVRRAQDEIKRAFPCTWGLNKIQFFMQDGEFVMRGELPTYYLRQKLLAVVQLAVGHTRIRDEIAVV